MSDIIKPLNTPEACKYLWDTWHIKRTPKTMEKYRSKGGGPEPFYIGINAFYWPADLDAWVLSIKTPTVGSASEARQIRRNRNQKLIAPGPNDLPPPRDDNLVAYCSHHGTTPCPTAARQTKSK
jgi:hypothetical protein